MKLEDIKAGMRVRIDGSCRKTMERFGFNGSMKELRGTNRFVANVDSEAVYIHGWQWHPDDIISIEFSGRKKPSKPPKPQTFDPSLLDI